MYMHSGRRSILGRTTMVFICILCLGEIKRDSTAHFSNYLLILSAI